MCPYRRRWRRRCELCAAARIAENLVRRPTNTRGGEKGWKKAAAAAENTIPPGVRKSMVGQRRLGSPAVADARTPLPPPPPRTGDPFDRNSTHTPARTFIPSGRRPSPSSSSSSSIVSSVFRRRRKFSSSFGSVSGACALFVIRRPYILCANKYIPWTVLPLNRYPIYARGIVSDFGEVRRFRRVMRGATADACAVTGGL